MLTRMPAGRWRAAYEARERHRRSAIRRRAQAANRIRVSEGANIKRNSVASDVVGMRGRAMPEAPVLLQISYSRTLSIQRLAESTPGTSLTW